MTRPLNTTRLRCVLVLSLAVCLVASWARTCEAQQGDEAGPVHAVLRELVKFRESPTLPAFPERLRAEAEAAADPGSTAEEWYSGIGWFGGLPSCFSAYVSSPVDPFSGQSRFGENISACMTGDYDETSRDFMLGLMPFIVAVEPSLGANLHGRLAIDRRGEFLVLTADNRAAWAMLNRVTVLHRYAEAFRANEIETIAPLTHNRDFVVRREAICALVRAGRPEILPWLQGVRDDPEDEIRFLAALGRARLGDIGAEPYLREFLHDPGSRLPSGSRKYRARIALGFLGFEDVRPLLKQQATSTDPFKFPTEAQRALDVLDGKAQPPWMKAEAAATP